MEPPDEEPQPPNTMPLVREDVLRAIRSLLPDLERLGDRVRIVGTASSVLRGIDAPAGDVDILASERAVVDELATAAAAAQGRCLSSPAWVENPEFGQYFASFELSGVRIEFSTVESATIGAEIGECTGDAPWQHFDVLELEGHRVPVVASELRLVSEIMRFRPDRWEPIAAHLSRNGYDEELLAAASRRLAPDLQATMRAAVQRTRGDASIEFSVSTWRQPMPPTAGAERLRVLERLVEMIDSLSDERLRIAIDGLTAAGKTSLGHELAQGLARRGRSVLRASLDDFKRPWSERHLYDRLSGEGYYRNAFDREAACRLLLEPSSPTADGLVALCSIDPLTQIDHSALKTVMPANGVLIVDGVFAYRPEINAYWDLRIWIEIDLELSVRRGMERDADMEGSASEAEKLHRDRYLVGELLYIDEVNPRSLVEVIVDNTDFDVPLLVRPSG